MSQTFLRKGLVYTSDNIRDNGFNLATYIKSKLNELNIPYVDDGCCAGAPVTDEYPVRFNSDNTELQYFDGDTWVEIPIVPDLPPQYFEFERVFAVGTPTTTPIDTSDLVPKANGTSIQEIEDDITDGKPVAYYIPDTGGTLQRIEPSADAYGTPRSNMNIYVKIQANNFNNANMTALLDKLTIMIGQLGSIEQKLSDAQRAVNDSQVKPIVTVIKP